MKATRRRRCEGRPSHNCCGTGLLWCRSRESSTYMRVRASSLACAVHPGLLMTFRKSLKGFTLLEVMVALAIMASVIITVLGAVNFQLGILSNERDNTAFTLLARARMAELEQQGQIVQKSNGTLAPAHPELTWQAELFPTEIPMLQKLVVRVRRDSDKREVALERYILK